MFNAADTIPYTIILVVILTIVLIGAILYLGRSIFLKSDFSKNFSNLFEIIAANDNKEAINNAPKAFTNYISEYLERRNDFWTTYGQIIISVFIVCIITLLLLTKIITAEAGLPLLSAVSGFTIAKSSTAHKSGSDFTPPSATPTIAKQG